MRKSLGGRGQPETVGWTVHVTLCVVVCYLCNSLVGPRWTTELFVSPCELILYVIAMNE